MATADDPNTETIGKYKVTQTLKNQLGQGTYGTVYLATCIDGGKEVAAKKVTVDKEYLKDSEFNVEREANILMHHISPHRNIVKVYDVIQQDFIEKRRPKVNIWLVTEYCKLGNLMDYAYATKMDSKAKLKIIYQLCLAVNHLHSQPESVVHRDIKPENILLTGKSTRPIVKLTDFGTARTVIREDGHSVLMGTLAGTDRWMAPEQLFMEGVKLEYNKSVDVYSTALSSLALLDCSKGSLMKAPKMNKKNLGAAMRELNASTDLTAIRYSPPINNAEDNDLDMAIKDILKPMLSFCPAHRPSMAEVCERMTELYSQTFPEVLLAVNKRSVWEREGDTWVQRPYVTEDDIGEFCFCAVSGGIMAVGGLDYIKSTVISRCYHFSLSTRCWERVADMITARAYASAAVLGDTMMVVGGEGSGNNDLAVCESFHIGEGVWISVASLLEPLFQTLVASAAGKMFVIPREYNVSGRKMQQYDPSLDRFSWVASIPDYVKEFYYKSSLVSCKDLLYLLGGYEERVAVQYNPSSDTWTQLVSQPLRM